MNGKFVRIETDFGLVVENNGDWMVVVRLPNEYRDQMEGLCGDFDGDANNDFVTKEGVDVKDNPNKHSVFGASWQVLDESDKT